MKPGILAKNQVLSLPYWELWDASVNGTDSSLSKPADEPGKLQVLHLYSEYLRTEATAPSFLFGQRCISSVLNTSVIHKHPRFQQQKFGDAASARLKRCQDAPAPIWRRCTLDVHGRIVQPMLPAVHNQTCWFVATHTVYMRGHVTSYLTSDRNFHFPARGC